ncbi:unnamed protein product [Rhizoctonia solani]|uniref:Uncharacterized protein n=1 Tax=Rhizoctonia solani TaxID=456999 RepID=A0A8H3CXI9_9AGAM|nr:unnamed protein product [Rhizoctonia solani]
MLSAPTTPHLPQVLLSMTMIPPELWRLIAYELQIQQNRQSLLNLCLTSVALNNHITPILYGCVDLFTTKSVNLFCRTFAEFAARLGPYIQTLRIGSYHSYRQWHRVELSTPLAEDLSAALKLMPNLRDLTAAMMTVGLSTCFDPLVLNPPFSLQKLAIPLTGTRTFYELLKSQPSIKDLHIGSEHTLGEYDFSHCLSTQPQFLPNLTSITAPISILKGAVPKRPISTVMIVTELLDWTDPGVTIIARSIWEPILCGSQVPITTIGIYHSPHSDDPWDQLIPAIKQFGVDKTLQRIKVVETLDPPVTEWSKQETLSQRVNQMKILKGFDQLESLEFSEMPGISSPASDVMRWVGGMGNITAWKKHVPSLQQAKMYGVSLPWLEAWSIDNVSG